VDVRTAKRRRGEGGENGLIKEGNVGGRRFILKESRTLSRATRKQERGNVESRLELGKTEKELDTRGKGGHQKNEGGDALSGRAPQGVSKQMSTREKRDLITEEHYRIEEAAHKIHGGQ